METKTKSITLRFEDDYSQPKTKPCRVDDCAIASSLKDELQLNGYQNAKPWMRAHEHTCKVLTAWAEAKDELAASKNFHLFNEVSDYLQQTRMSREHVAFFRGLYAAGGVEAIRDFFNPN